jgi:ABC-type dipeptide/oligopeptide/nickel transport system ATPase component
LRSACYDPSIKVSYDPDKAKKLLAESGYSPEKPVKFKIQTTRGFKPKDYETVQAIVGMWRKVGIDAEIEVHYELRAAHKLAPMAFYNWGDAIGDPTCSRPDGLPRPPPCDPAHRAGSDAVSPRGADAERRARAIFERFSLPLACLDRYPHELSGGQRQRVGIARAALLAPDLIVADEIVSGLDVSTQAQALNLLKTLSRDPGLAMAFVSHDLSVIRAVCDGVYVLHAGRVVEEGACDTVFALPKSAYNQALLHAIPLPRVDPGWLQRTPDAGGGR